MPDASDAAPVYADLASLGSDDEFGASITKVVGSRLITHYVQVHEAPGVDANIRLVEQPHPPFAEEAQIRSAVLVQVAHCNGRTSAVPASQGPPFAETIGRCGVDDGEQVPSNGAMVHAQNQVIVAIPS